MPAPAGSTVAFGASTTWGWGGGSGGYGLGDPGSYDGDSYPRQLAALTTWDVVNEGIPGDMLTAGSTHDPFTNGYLRFNDYVANNPGIRCMVIWEGVNDIAIGQSLTDLHTAYTRMIAAAATAGTPVFVMTLQPQGWTGTKETERQQLNNWLRAGHGAYVIDAEQKLKGADSTVMSPAYIANGISANPQTGYPHLSSVGYAVVAQAVTSGTNNPVTSVPLVTY